MTEFPEAAQIAEMVDREKGATPLGDNSNLSSAAKKKQRAKKKVLQKKAKAAAKLAQKSKGKEKALPDDVGGMENLDPPCSDPQFNQWFKSGAKSGRECKSTTIRTSVDCPYSVCRFHCHPSPCLCGWRTIAHCRNCRRRFC